MHKGVDRDALFGALLLAAGALALGLVYGKDMKAAGNGFNVDARFRHADGINVGSDVRMSGMVVGKVAAERLDPDFKAITTLRITADVALPTDTSAAILTDGLLGAKYIDLKPGAEDATLAPGAEIVHTQDSIMIDDLLEKIINEGRSKRGYRNKPIPNQD